LRVLALKNSTLLGTLLQLLPTLLSKKKSTPRCSPTLRTSTDCPL
jgi:hypothetical protein